MPKVRKQKRRKVFQYNVNRKRIKKRRQATGRIKCPEVKEFFEYGKPFTKNIVEMGISLNPNETIPIPNIKKDRLELVKTVNDVDMDLPKPKHDYEANPQKKARAIGKLETEANTLRPSRLRLPKEVVSKLSYFLDKYGLDYNSMTKDRKNFDQLTWRQFRAKIKKFMSIPEQFDVYLNSRGLNRENLPWKEFESDGE